MKREKKFRTTPYRSPKNLTEEMINDVLTDFPDEKFLESKHISRAWADHFDDKEIHKLVLRVMMDMTQHGQTQPLYSLITFCMQCGFDLHAAYGDAGPAHAYIEEEKVLLKNEEEKAKLQQEANAIRFRESLLGSIPDQIIAKIPKEKEN